MASSAKAPVPVAEQLPFVVPEGIDLEYRSGPITGKPMYKVVGFNMPFMGSEEAAVQVYQRLSTAYQNNFFNAAARK